MTHVLGIIAVTAVIILCTVLPFLPGRYDSLAIPLSLMAQLLGKVGLVLVPIGVLWMASERFSRLARARHVFAVTALIAATAIWCILSLGVFLESITLGLTLLALGMYVVVRVVGRFGSWRATTERSTIPLYLVAVPILVALIQFALAGPVTEFSRGRAIRNSASLIADIEQYRAANGRYPESLISLWLDHYKPGVIGIREYLYEPSGDAYNVIFEQIALNFGTREIVMYNPRDRQTMTSHKLDRLQLTPQQLALEHTRGHYAAHDSGHPHWKYFWFD